MEILDRYHPQFAHDIMTTRHEVGMSLAQAAGLPCGEHDQEPYDLIRLFPLSISPDAYEGFDNLAGTMTDTEEHEVIVSFFFIWVVRAISYFKQYEYSIALKKIKLMSTRLSRKWDGKELPESCSCWFDWFQKEREYGPTA